MNVEQEEGVVIQEVQGMDVVYQQDKATIDMQISTAKAYPRNIKRATENSITVVTMDTDTASTCTYAVPRGGKQITGPSIHLAKILAQFWGNLRIEAKVINIDAKHITSQAVAYDLENNLAIKVEVKRSITGKYGRFNDDMITVTGNAGNSIAMRNAILSVIPRAVVDKVYNEAKKTITGDISDATKLMAKRKKVLDQFKDVYNVTEAEVLKSIGKASIDHIDADNLVTLIGIGQAIKDGDTTIEEAFKSKVKDKTTTATATANVEPIEIKETQALKDKKKPNSELPLN
jgi:hypothetical protein